MVPHILWNLMLTTLYMTDNTHFPRLLALCVGNSLITSELPTHRPVTQSFDVFFDLRLNKRLCKQSWGWWIEIPSRPLWRHCNVTLHWHYDVGKCYQILFSEWLMVHNCPLTSTITSTSYHSQVKLILTWVKLLIMKLINTFDYMNYVWSLSGFNCINVIVSDGQNEPVSSRIS